jgi:transcriptional regulator with XRE-family HTH domain/Zn-dependent peptidase ImmA (M78 family)
MDKKLNTRLISEMMLEKGLSQQDLADKIGVSKAAVSKWLKPESFPKPSYLLKLGKLLGIRHNDLVSLTDTVLTPQVAFRKSGNYKIKDEHIEQFQFVARLLKKLCPYLPFDKYSNPPTLSNPAVDYKYIQEVAAIVRQGIAKPSGEIEYTSLISLFNDLKAILIPVLWDKKAKKQGTHIYLPDSKTTWIFLNIDSSIFDFKFWMAHELGHAKAPFLEGDIGEDFADRFAGALLFPETMAKSAYEELENVDGVWNRVNKIVELAKSLMISPLTIYYQLKFYSDEYSLSSLDLEQERAIFRATTDMNSQYENLSCHIFKTENPSVQDYLQFSETGFGSVFFNVLKEALHKEGDISPKFISNVLDISLADAYEIMKELITDEQPKENLSI